MKTTAAAIFFAAFCACTSVSAEAIEGVLEKGTVYSALFAASPESGDLIGFAVKNQSRAGKTILAACLPGMVCKVEKAATRDMDSAAAPNFAGTPSGWFEITTAKDVGMVSAISTYDKSIKTRYGVLSVRDEGQLLMFKGKPVMPAVEGNSGLGIVAQYEQDKTDLVLIQNTGGTACPALFRFITVSAVGVRMTPEFGTCSDVIYPTINSESATITMNEFRGPFESEVEKQKTYMTKTVFRFANGRVTENGKPLK